MLYMIGTLREVDQLESKLPISVFTELVRRIAILEKDLTETEQRRADAVLKIVEYADNPDGDEFRQAVAIHRNATTSIAAKKVRLARLTGITQ